MQAPQCEPQRRPEPMLPAWTFGAHVPGQTCGPEHNASANLSSPQTQPAHPSHSGGLLVSPVQRPAAHPNFVLFKFISAGEALKALHKQTQPCTRGSDQALQLLEPLPRGVRHLNRHLLSRSYHGSMLSMLPTGGSFRFASPPPPTLWTARNSSVVAVTS